MYNNLYDFSQLALETRNKVISFGASSTTSLFRYDKGIELLSKYLQSTGQTFSKEIGLEWLDTIPHSPSKVHDSSYTIWVAYKRMVFLLADNLEGHLHEWKMYKEFHVSQLQTKEYANIFIEYKKHLELNDYAHTTIKRKLQEINRFLIYLEGLGFSFTNINNEHIADYFLTSHFDNRKPRGIRTEANDIKLFLEYAEENKLTPNANLHYAVPVYNIVQEKIVTTISEEAENCILEEHPGYVADKREKASYLLALHMGLRSSDIYNLRFQDIDWEKGILRLKQKKTGIPLILEMDAETQNALIDYILHERRQLDSPYIFITAFGHLKRKMGHCRSLESRVKNLDVSTNLPNNGLHILRRTFASRLLQNGTPLPVISAALGHIGKDSIKSYLSTDIEKMRRCALSLSGITCRREEF